MGRYQIALGIPGKKPKKQKAETISKTALQSSHWDRGLRRVRRQRAPSIRLITAEGLTEEQLDNLREQVNRAFTDPDFSIITNYNVNWQEIQINRQSE